MPQVNILIDINESTYLRNPLETNLGKKILFHSIDLMYDTGFEDFNFRKLAIKMESTEASIYRYFENKYMLLAYLVAWYWDYIHFLILMETRNIKKAKERLKISITTLVNSQHNKSTPEYIDQPKLHAIVVENAAKVYHTKKVDDLNKVGFYLNYKKLVKTLAANILEIDSKYKYPRALATSIIEQSLNYEYYIAHLPNLTDHDDRSKIDARTETLEMIWYMVNRLL